MCEGLWLETECAFALLSFHFLWMEKQTFGCCDDFKGPPGHKVPAGMLRQEHGVVSDVLGFISFDLAYL